MTTDGHDHDRKRELTLTGTCGYLAQGRTSRDCAESEQQRTRASSRSATG